MKTLKKIKINYRHIICTGITLCFIAMGVFCFSNAFGRLIESLRDVGISFAYYFCELFDIHGVITPTVNDLPEIPFFKWFNSPNATLPNVSVPENWAAFKVKWAQYWKVWANKETFNGYLAVISNILYVISKIFVLALPFILCVYLLIRQMLKTENNDYDKDSKALQSFKRFTERYYTPVKNKIADFIAFVKERKYYYVTWLCLWGLYFNVFTIVVEFAAYYFYFVVSFDIINLYRQVYKLCLDLYVPFNFIPWWGWTIICCILFDKIRKNIAYATLNHFERKNRGFINARPIVFMVCGTMGKKKTTAITDMALSQEVMLRDKAFEKILENDLKFPNFPWINLENEIKRAMEYHEIYNLATVRQFADKKRERFIKTMTKEKIFGYDFNRYGMIYDDRLKLTDIWETIKTYSLLYFIYVIQSSLLISNYSIRVDGILSDLGNFPLWNADFFKTDSRLIDSYSRHAHIIDFDSLRLGRKVVENNIKANCFDFGVVVITEVGKERGNSLELSEKKKKDETTNQKNDLFNSWLKMVRHSATVDNYPFVRVIADEQRPESWGADARDLCEIVHIKESGETRLAMPFFSLAELLYDWLYNKFSGLYYEYRYTRGDNTLAIYLLKGLTAKMRGYYTGIYNRFGYCELAVEVESGTQDGELAENRYYLMSKKIYSKRFSTDCFSDFFTEKALRSPVGINDLAEYATERATFGELAEQNSYFINDLLNGLKNDKNKED